jgi:dTDP-4-dehydrorhamnose reductase
VKILLTGPTGQVGSALLDTLPSLGEVIPLDRSELDLASAESIRAAVRAVRPEVIVNAAAYTAVDRAESEEPLAMAVNRDAPAVLAEEAARLGALLVHFSTDYVFDGEKPTPYVESDVAHPLNAYGRTKLAGERAIEASGCRHLIFRTSWVYAASGKNFLLTMLGLARQGKPLRVVDDQFGAPTSNLMIAAAVPEAIRRGGSGVFHMSAQGETTWYRFARAIFEATSTKANLSAIPSSGYKTPARRPRNSMLDNTKLEQHFGMRMPSWEDGMRQVIQALR